MTFIGIDLAGDANGPALALIGADLARATALLAPLQPVENTQAGGNRQRRTQRTEIAAEKLSNKQGRNQQSYRVGDVTPLALEAQGDGGLEGLYLDQAADIAYGL